MTNRLANLNESELKKLRELEEELNCILVAYEPGQGEASFELGSLEFDVNPT